MAGVGAALVISSTVIQEGCVDNISSAARN